MSDPVIRRLQWQVRGLAALLLLVVAMGLAAPAPTRIDLVSPDNKSRVLIRADNGIAGVWVVREGGKTAAMWALEGSTAVAVQGVVKKDRNDVLLSADSEGGYVRTWNDQWYFTLQGVGAIDDSWYQQ